MNIEDVLCDVLHVSFSGGRTSAYMTKRLLDTKPPETRVIVTFANTGLEHPKTLEFIKRCDDEFGFNTVWLEAVVHPNRKAPTHRIVTFETASRKGEPFEAVIAKYGVPNTKYPGCTRDLKINPINSYLKSLGIKPSSIATAIGIRADEQKRINRTTAKEGNFVYPLADWFPCDKDDVLDWWSQQDFDLGIEEFEGNCAGCFKKSLKKHFLQIKKDPSVYEFHARMEQKYRFTGPQDGPRHFFRGNVSTEGLLRLYADNSGDPSIEKSAADEGCSESCEAM